MKLNLKNKHKIFMFTYKDNIKFFIVKHNFVT